VDLLITRPVLETGMTDRKRCTKCREVKSLDQFYRRAASKSGYQFQCKSCQAAWQSDHADMMAEKAKRWRKNNPERAKAISRRYKRRHPDRVAAALESWRSRNREHELEYGRRYDAERRVKVEI